MKTIRPTIDWSKRLATTVVVTAIAATPLINVSVSQAKPPSHAPAWGYGKNKKGKKNKNHGHNGNRNNGDDDRDNGDGNGDDGDRDNDRDDNGDSRDDNGDYRDDNNDDRNTNQRVLTGVVTRDLSGNRFEIRTDRGRLVTVRLDQQNEPNSLSRGDRVRVEGGFRGGNVFIADNLDILSNVDGGSGGISQHVNFSATVLNILSTRRLTVRGDNNRTYTVESRTTLGRIDNGDRVRIVGQDRGGVVRAQSVVLLNNTDGSGTGGGIRRIDFNGVITHIADDGHSLVVVADDGRRLTVRYNSARNFQIGDHVAVTGILAARYVVASRITRR